MVTLAHQQMRNANDHEELVARGEQQVACMRRENARLVPTPVPLALQEALVPYAIA